MIASNTEYLYYCVQFFCSSLTAHAQMPRLETVENCMKVSQMTIQGVEAKSSQLLQLPHIRPDMLRHFVTKKVG